MEFVFYFLPKTIQYCAAIASVVLLILIWRRTRVFGFALVAGILVLSYVSSLLIMPYLAKSSTISFMPIYAAWFSMTFGVLGAIAWWLIYAHYKRAEA
ncbi:hypothetical protein [Novilysobacter erysipheiresistens]|uniref:Uncharacterized protein n=1 Tax=Novilysobacter erysipheiresistens TaxID=1749332 RepID=A0ABU7Z1V9_9GAMM